MSRNRWPPSPTSPISPHSTDAELTETSGAAGPLTPPSPGNSDWPDANPVPIGEPEKAITTTSMAIPAPGRTAGATDSQIRLLQSRARYGLSAFSFLEPELPGSSYPAVVITSQARNWIIRRRNFGPGHCGSPARGAGVGPASLPRTAPSVSGAAPCRLRPSDAAHSATSPWWLPRLALARSVRNLAEIAE